MPKIRSIELLLIQFIIYSLLWLWDEYLASLLTLVFTAIAIFILVISLMAELIEPSKVPRWYFTSMIVSIIAPILATIVFVYFVGMEFEWLTELDF